MGADTQPKAAPCSPAEFLKLVDDYGNAALKAGQSNSGLCISPAAGTHWEHMQKLRERLRSMSSVFEPSTSEPKQEVQHASL